MGDLDQLQLDARRTLLEQDPPRHTRAAEARQHRLLPRAVRAYTDATVHLTRTVLDEALRRSSLDFVAGVAQEVPIRVLCRLLGVPAEHTAALAALGNRMVSDAPDPADAPPAGDEASGTNPETAGGDHRLLPFGHPAALEAFAIPSELAA